MNRPVMRAAAVVLCGLVLACAPRPAARAQGDMEGTPYRMSTHPTRHAYHRSPSTHATAFEAIRAEADRQSQANVDNGGTVFLRTPNPSWTYVWPFNSPYYWDASRSYDWTYYWWRADRERHRDRRGLGPNDG